MKSGFSTTAPLVVAKSATSLCLPWPPSVNGYWQPFAIPGGRVVMTLTKRARMYRSEVAVAIRKQLGGAVIRPYLGHVRVDVELRAPDCRKRDIDNHDGKSLFDALTHAGVWKDDSQVRARTSRFGQNIKDGCVNVLIAALDAQPETFPDASEPDAIDQERPF